MTIEFLADKFDKYERRYEKPYIGFFAPNGDLVDYNTILGGSHSELGNIVSWTFLLWIKDYEYFSSCPFYNYKISTKIDFNSGNIISDSFPIEEYNKENNLIILQKDLINFLEDIKNNENFLEIIKNKIDLSKIPNYIKEGKEIPSFVGIKGAESIFEIESVFGEYNTKELLYFLKDICVQYLGYDSIEQFKPDGKMLVFPKYYALYPKEYLTIYDKPRVITSPNRDINERFFNYLIMDWKIEEIPRYIYNKDTDSFTICDNSIISDEEEMYIKEIENIKKLVPLKERQKYFI